MKRREAAETLGRVALAAPTLRWPVRGADDAGSFAQPVHGSGTVRLDAAIATAAAAVVERELDAHRRPAT